jgi:hypothetical protein
MVDPDRVFDTEVADRMSQGCGRHPGPSCLCDVDVSRTEHIEWTRGPAELVGAATPQELVALWSQWVYDNEIESQVKPLRAVEEAKPRAIGAPNAEDWHRPRYMSQLADMDDVTEVVERLRSGEPAKQIAADLGLPHQQVGALSVVLGTNRVGHVVPPWKLYAINRYKDGAMPKQIHREIVEQWGMEPSLKSVQTLTRRNATRGAA